MGRRGLIATIGIFTLLVSLFIFTILWAGRSYTTVTIEHTYYFLVRDCEETTSAAVAGQSYVSGGAGYLWGDNVVLACYYTRSDAERISLIMEEKGIETNILTQNPATFSLHGTAAEQAAHIKANAETADTCARMFYDCANGLERGTMSQEEARAAVRGAAKSLKGLREGNTGTVYNTWNAELYRAEHRAEELASGILFAKDLRYSQVQLLMSVLSIEDCF